jgi:non-ribosomal peptide synthase protein (TIGR01720 family)
LLAEKSYWLQQLSLPFGPVPGQVQGLDSLQDEIHEFSCTLTQEETQQLLGECNKAYRTRVNELLIAALLKGYQDWSGQPILRLIIEGHGREELFETLDVTETVGWFTSIYPLVLSSTLDLDLAGQIKLVKEQCRHLPCNGMGYGILTKIVKDPELSSLELAQESQSIVFNYLGTFDNLQNDDLLFCSTRENTGANRSSRQSQTELISINGLVANGQLCFRFTGSSKRICPKAMADFCEAFEKALKSCIAWCTGKNPRKNLRSKVILRADAESIDEGIEI